MSYYKSLASQERVASYYEQTLPWLRACDKHGTSYYEQVTSRLRLITCRLRLITNMLRSGYVLLRTSNYEQIRTISRLITSKSEPDNVLLRANQTRSCLTTSISRPYHKHVANSPSPSSTVIIVCVWTHILFKAKYPMSLPCELAPQLLACRKKTARFRRMPFKICQC